jgi:hypothetical protein
MFGVQYIEDWNLNADCVREATTDCRQQAMFDILSITLCVTKE